MLKIKNEGIRLIQKGKQSAIKAVFGRLGFILLCLAVQIFLIVMVIMRFNQYTTHIVALSIMLAVGMGLYLLNSTIDPTAKITWLIVIIFMPVFGALFFLYTQKDVGHRMLKKHHEIMLKNTDEFIQQDEKVLTKLKEEAPEVASLHQYLNKSGCFPVYDGCDVEYFSLGEYKFKEVLNQLKKARSFIFMEYFIVHEGLMWGKVLEILAEKVKEGVEVRVMYDGTCEFSTLPHDYPERMKELGIQCKMFAPVRPFLSTHYNYRDHRKILVIDNEIAFTGGINMADEYINRVERFGHWKDTAVMVRGRAAQSFTLMFLQMWNVEERKIEVDKYVNHFAPIYDGADGYVMPYADCPVDKYKVGEMVYMDLLNRAQKYVHIMTPYLILDGELETALKFAAERGVQVQLILPGIPDKKIPYALAKTHYQSLLDSGVEIYEYEPGFVHAKVWTVDGEKAVVGTINLDYRSLYHHFECGCFMYKVNAYKDIEEDFQRTLSLCRKVTNATIRNESWKMKFIGRTLKWIAPLL